MANKFLSTMFGGRKAVEQELEKIRARELALEARISGFEKSFAALVDGLYCVKQYRIGAKLENGIFEKEISFSEVPESCRDRLLSQQEASSVSGSTPVAWAGTRWILIKK